MAGRIIDFATSCFIFGWHIIWQSKEVRYIDKISDTECKALRNANVTQLQNYIHTFIQNSDDGVSHLRLSVSWTSSIS
jgi:hypothetical protein